MDLGGSGSRRPHPELLRRAGPLRVGLHTTRMDICHDMTHEFQDELHRPAFPYKFKIKFSGCPNDCVASIARSDMSVIGTWRDDIQQSIQAEVKAYAEGGKMDIAERRRAANARPSACRWDGTKLTIDNSNCVSCMHCINLMPKALRPGKDRARRSCLARRPRSSRARCWHRCWCRS